MDWKSVCQVSPRRCLLLLLLCLLPLTSCSTKEMIESWRSRPETKSAADSSDLWVKRQKQVNLEMLARALARHPRAFLNYKAALRLVHLVDTESQKYNVDPLRMLALIVVESAGQPHIVSASNARGLMQLLPETGQFIAETRGEVWKGEESLFDVQVNVAYGIWYYHHLCDFFDGDRNAALAAYNWGPGTIQDRQRTGIALPVVYPDRVKREEAWLAKEWKRENQKHFWKRIQELEG